MGVRVIIFFALFFCPFSLAASSGDNTCVGDPSGTCSDSSSLLQGRVKVSEELGLTPDGDESLVEHDTTVEVDMATTRVFAGVPVYNYHLAHPGGMNPSLLEQAEPVEWEIIFKKGFTQGDENKFCKYPQEIAGTTVKCEPEGHPDTAGGLPWVQLTAADEQLKKILAWARKEGMKPSFVEPNGVVEADPVFDESEGADMSLLQDSGVDSWGLDRIDDQAGLDGSYNPHTQTQGAGAHVYVADTGIRTTHQDFQGRAFPSIDCLSSTVRECNGDVNCAYDRHGHGTHCAGTVGGNRFGVAKKTALYAVKVLSDRGSGSFGGILRSVDWIATKGQKPAVWSASLGGRGVSHSLERAFQLANANGVTIVVAAGNSRADACGYSPAFATSALTVGATYMSGGKDRRAGFSNYGRCVDVLAPGVSIVSASATSDTGTKSMSGTSMACPHVAGAAALLLADHPGMAPQALRKHLTANSLANIVQDVRGSANLMLYTGSGMPPTGNPPTELPPTEAPTGAPTPAPTSVPTPAPTTAPTTAPGPCADGDVMMADSSGQLLSSVSGNKAYIPWIKHGKDWYPICGHYFWDNNYGASTFCKKLGFQTGVRVHTREKYSKDSMPVGKCFYGQGLTKCSAGGNAWGNLGYRNKYCGAGSSIGVKIVCSGASGNPSSCEKAPTLAPTRAPTPAPTPAPTSAPTTAPTPAPAPCADGEVMMADSSGQLLSAVSGNKAYIPWIKHGKDWYPICGHYFWDNNDGASTFCRKLGFQTGSRVHTREKYSKDAMPVGKCFSGQHLTQCRGGGNAWGNLGYRNKWCGAGKSIGVKIVCRGSGTPSSCEKAPQPLVPGLKEEIFYNIHGMRKLPDLSKKTPSHIRKVPQPYYRNTGGRWPAFEQKHNYAVRWTGFLKIALGGRYSFYIYSDDGSKLWIDNAQLVDNDGVHGWRGRSASKEMTPGTHTFRAEMFERTGWHGMEVKYSGPDARGLTRIPSSAFLFDGKVPAPAPPALKEERFYKITPGMRRLPNLNELGTPCDTKQVAQPYYRNTGSNWPSWPEKDNFAVRWTGLLKIRSHGRYTFWTYSDDGSKLWIDNRQVVNNDGLHGWRGRAGSKTLGAGNHVFKAEMFERGGAAGMEVKYRGRDTSYRTTRIPSSAFVAK